MVATTTASSITLLGTIGTAFGSVIVVVVVTVATPTMAVVVLIMAVMPTIIAWSMSRCRFRHNFNIVRIVGNHFVNVIFLLRFLRWNIGFFIRTV